MRKKRSNRKRYPKNWKQQATACKEQAHWQCETCKEAHLTVKVSKRTGLVYRMRLHAAHIGRYTRRPHLKALCPLAMPHSIGNAESSKPISEWSD